MIPPRRTLNELLAAKPQPIEYIVADLLARESLSLLAAHPKAGKSVFVRNLMAAILDQESFLGRTTTPGPVLYYVLEEPEVHIAHDFRRMGFESDLLHVRVGQIPRFEMHEVIERDIEETEAVLAVIDPLFDALTIDETNAYGPVNRAMKSLLFVARKSRCHILTVHHTNKSDARGGLSILGSQALRGATDTNMFLLRRGDGTRLFETEQRFGTPFDLCTLSYTPETMRVGLGRTVKALRVERLEEQLLKVLGDKRLTKTQWRASVKGRNTEIQEVIDKLASQGAIVGVQEGRSTYWTKA